MGFAKDAVLVTLVLLMAIAANAPIEILNGLGLNPLFVKSALIFWIVVGLCVYRGLAVIILTTLIVLGANLPDDMAKLLGINRNLLIGTLLIMVGIAVYRRYISGR